MRVFPMPTRDPVYVDFLIATGQGCVPVILSAAPCATAVDDELIPRNPCRHLERYVTNVTPVLSSGDGSRPSIGRAFDSGDPTRGAT